MSEAFFRAWAARGERERMVIALALTVIALALLYAYLWLPVTRERDRLLLRIPELRAEAQAMEHDARALENLRPDTRRPAPDLKAVLRQAAVDSGFALAGESITLQGEKARIAIASARTEQVLAWIARLQSHYGVRVENMQGLPVGDQGMARIDAVLGMR